MLARVLVTAALLDAFARAMAWSWMGWKECCTDAVMAFLLANAATMRSGR